MQHVLSKFKIRPHKKEKTLSFLRDFNESRSREAKDSLLEAKITLEAWFVESNESGDYLYIYKQLESAEHLKHCVATSTSPLYRDIRAWAAECLETRDDWDALAVVQSGA